VDAGGAVEHLRELTATLSEVSRPRPWRWTTRRTTALRRAVRRREGDRDTVLPKMVELRTLGDALGTMVADDLWPLPTYREIALIK